MVIVTTDTVRIWDLNEPIFEKLKDAMLVVCLNGKKVSDKYECFVSPYDLTDKRRAKLGADDRRLTTLSGVAAKLNRNLHYHEDVVFLTDTEPSTLYPYYVIKELNEYNSLHLIAIPPLNCETNSTVKWYYEMLNDLSHLRSLMIYDTNAKFTSYDKSKELDSFYSDIRSDIISILPRILNGINDMDFESCYFDFSSLSYISIKDGFDNIDIRNKEKEITEIDF